jgi:23S rRNA (uracil1939-C5)-methyltransferase
LVNRSDEIGHDGGALVIKLSTTAVTIGTNELQIARLGARGDGIAATDAGPRYVAFALPGERVEEGAEGLPRLLSAPSADRATPLCRHFGVCGGCAAQHMGERLYADWKRDIVVAAFRQRGLAPDIAPLRRLPPGTRRRAVLTARRVGKRIALGYHLRKSLDVVDIEECPVLRQQILAKFPALRAIAAAMAAPEVRLTVLSTSVGLDIAVETRKGRVGRDAVAALGRIAEEHRLARVAVGGETVIERAHPILRPAGIDVAVPPGVFVQAVEEAENGMAQLVLAGIGSSKSVADLFCGTGTFTFHLARQARVLAIDSDAAAIAAVADAARRAQRLRPIEAKVRDLFRAPLSAKELERFDAVVFDPPRAGARSQAQQLADSKVRTAIAVSCDPGTLARDVRLLVDGGYSIDSVTPIDQFLFSPHVETVVVLRRHTILSQGLRK